MIKAQATMPDGRVLVLMGISEANVVRLRAGEPIYFDARALHIEGQPLGSITLFYGKDDGELGRTVKTLIGPQTEVIAVPRGDGPTQ